MDTSYREPKVGVWFWWVGHDNPKIIRSFYVCEVNDLGICMTWNTDAGRVMTEAELKGSVTWTRQEWDKAWNNKECCVYLIPVNADDLQPNQELCRSCNGTRWEQMKDLEYTPCIWCDFTGVSAKAVPAIESTKQRSPLHPKV